MNLSAISDILSQVLIDGVPYDFSDRFEFDELKSCLYLRLGFACDSQKKALESTLLSALSPLGVSQVVIDDEVMTAPSINASNTIEGVKNILVVASGKGGVGKSTVAVNLALSLVAEGASVGLLDADIYGPSVTHMLGLSGLRPNVVDGKTIVPLKAFGLKSVSMGNLVTENTPMVWRGPIVSGALQQLLNNAQWGSLDYLVVDMPPGTGDIQLTLSQTVPVSASLIVTTPQDIALLDAKKGIEMFNKVDVPILGVVENMAVNICEKCGHEDTIFGELGGETLADEFGVPSLGQLPLKRSIREGMDSGHPPVLDESTQEAQSYRKMARRVAAELSFLADSGMPEIQFTD